MYEKGNFTIYHQKLIITHKQSELTKRNVDTWKSVINHANPKTHTTISNQERSERCLRSALGPEHLLKTSIWPISKGGFISAT